jgi:hypothetical protein
MPSELITAITTLVGAGLGFAGGVWTAVLSRRTQVDVARLASAPALFAEKRSFYGRFIRNAEDLREAARQLPGRQPEATSSDTPPIYAISSYADEALRPLVHCGPATGQLC